MWKLCHLLLRLRIKFQLKSREVLLVTSSAQDLGRDQCCFLMKVKPSSTQNLASLSKLGGCFFSLMCESYWSQVKFVEMNLKTSLCEPSLAD